jgi:hypothetical protein
MGREATCHCKWGDEEGDCKVLLEGRELIVRQGIRRRVALSSLANVAARGSKLVFHVERQRVELTLGAEEAQRWAKAITCPPPSLASKLGILPTTRLSVIGTVQSAELEKAISAAAALSGEEADLILISVDTQAKLNLALEQCFACSLPLWVVYPKGPASELKESGVRDLLRHHGYVDTKVASVSPALTALRFTQRKSNS